MIRLKWFLVYVLIATNAAALIGQNAAPSCENNLLHYVNYDTNELVFPNGEPLLNRFFRKLDTIVFRGEGQVKILHFGGSHIQADIYTHQTRKKMQNITFGMNSGRGLIFPVKIAKSNNPGNFKVTYNGTWERCLNTDRHRNCNLGATGMMVRTADSCALFSIAIDTTGDNHYPTNKIKIFHNTWNSNCEAELIPENPYQIKSVEKFPEKGYTEILLNQYIETFRFKVYRTDTLPQWFELYGIELLSDDPGIVYSAVGVNGATIPAFLRCNLLEQHVGIVDPDLIIISLGTNDGYSRKFNKSYFKERYLELIRVVKNAAPNANIILTVPNDCYLYRRYRNYNTLQQEEVIYELAEQYNCAVWNLYQIMGGLGSSKIWMNEGQMKRDRIHFTTSGYLLKGDLFFDALMKAYGEHLGKRLL